MEGVATELRKSGYNVILPELPAHGSDKTLAKDVQFSDYVTKVVSELDKQDDKVILLGHSFAGTIISEAAEQRPEKKKKKTNRCVFSGRLITKWSFILRHN